MTCTHKDGCNFWKWTADCSGKTDGDEFCEMEQLDTNENEIGDVCECEGDFDCDTDVDGDDTTLFIEDLGRSIWYNPCTNEDQCKGDFDCDGDVDGDDTTKFLEDLGRSIWYDQCPVCVAGDWCGY